MAWVSADHIAPRGGSYEPARQFDFMVEFGMLPGIEFAVQSTNLPNISTEPIEIPFMNETRKVAGKIVVEAGELIVRDYIEPDVAALVNSWRDRVVDVKEGKIFRAADYKSDGFIFTYDGEGNEHQLWRLTGCWPSSVNYGQLDYGTSDQIQITISIQIDKAWKIA